MKGKKKILTLDEYLDGKGAKGGDAKDIQKKIYTEKYRKSIENAKGDSTNELKLIDDFGIKSGKYSLKTRIKNNVWIKTHHPASAAQKWLFQEVFKNPKTYRYGKMILFQGGLFTFEYKNPKYKGTSQLPWFDKFPLVLSLGPVVTNLGVRNIGFNLHLLPPKIRIVVLVRIFELYKKLYRYQIFFKRDKPVQIRYQVIIKALEKFGVKFCVRMYIPSRMRQIVVFPYTDWYRAVFLPSRGYDSIKAAQLIKEWKDYCRKHGEVINPNVDWKTLI